MVKKFLIYVRGFAFLASILGLVVVGASDSHDSKAKLVASDNICSLGERDTATAVQYREDTGFYLNEAGVYESEDLFVSCGGFL